MQDQDMIAVIDATEKLSGKIFGRFSYIRYLREYYDGSFGVSLADYIARHQAHSVGLEYGVGDKVAVEMLRKEYPSIDNQEVGGHPFTHYDYESTGTPVMCKYGWPEPCSSSGVL